MVHLSSLVHLFCMWVCHQPVHETALQADECLVALCSLVKVPAVACMLPSPVTDETKRALEKISDAGVLAKDAGSCPRNLLHVSFIMHEVMRFQTILTTACTLELWVKNGVAMVVSIHGPTKWRDRREADVASHL